MRSCVVESDLDLDVGFESPSYDGMEGDTADLVITLNRPADRDITVVLNTSPDSATGNG